MSQMIFSDLVPTVPAGFGLACNKYLSGRVTAMVAGHGGLLNVRYYGTQSMGAVTFFDGEMSSVFNKLFRLQILIGGKAYFPEFNNTQHFPFGYRSECRLAGVLVRHELLVLQDALVHRVVVLDNPAGLSVSARVLHHSHNRHGQNNRTFSPFAVSGGNTPILAATVTDTSTPEGGTPETVVTRIALAADRPLKITNTHSGFKFYLDAAQAPGATGAAGESVCFFLLFTPGDEAAQTARLAALRTGANAECDALFAAYAKLLAGQTGIATGDARIDSALRNVMPVIRALGIVDTPGAYRASQDYWVWGWDSLVHSDAMLYAGCPDIVRDMLRFYRDFAHPEKGVLHAFNLKLEPHHYMAFGAQCLYVTVLYNYYAATGDKSILGEVFPFAKWIIEKALADVRADTGLTVGLGFYPDFPQMHGQTGRDLSIINNSLFYQALRAGAVIANAAGDQTFAKLCADKATAAREGLEKVLFDRETGYWIDSVSSDDLSPRRHHPLYAMLWVSPFAAEPGAQELPRVRAFMKKNYPFPEGLYMYPPQSASFMADGNQLGAYYPSVDRSYWNLAGLSGDGAELGSLKHIIGRYWQEHTYPEGLTHETENADPTSDNPGCKQAFAAKAWYCDYLELALGLSVDARGITINPLPGCGELRLDRLVLRGKRFSITVRGSGTAAEILLNGKTANGSRKFAWDALGEFNTIEINFTDGARGLSAVRGDELAIAVQTATAKELVLQINGEQEGLLWLAAPAAPVITVDGKPATVNYQPQTGLAPLWLQPGTHTVRATLA